MNERVNYQVVPLSEVPEDESDGFTTPRRPVVLVVDDERLVADSLSAILSRAGYAAFAAYDGETALEFADMIHPELLITDVAMPGINGVELALALIHLVQDCKVLLFSGHATQDHLAIARKAGHHFTLLSKPVHPTDLLRHIQRTFGFAESRLETTDRPMGWPMKQFSSAD